jgi:hypothetical protein
MLLFLLLTCTGPEMVMAQSFPAGNIHHSLELTAFDTEAGTVYTFWKDSLRIWEGPQYNSPKELKFKGVPEEFHVAYVPVAQESTLYFIHRAGGLVYKLEEDSLVRQDNSFNHKMQINSTILTYRDTILRYGGYGFWSHREFFTYFSKDTKEWEVIAPVGRQEIPRGRQDTQVTVDEPYIYIFSGISLDRVNPLQNAPNRKAWRFDMDLRRWEYLGEVPEDYHNLSQMAHMGDKILYLDWLKPRLILADPSRNTATYYARRAEFHNTVGLDKIRHKYQSYYRDSTFYLLTKIPDAGGTPWKGNMRYDLVPFDEFLGEPLGEEPLYTKPGFPWKPIGAFLGVAGLIGLFLFGRKRYLERNKVVVSPKGVRYARQPLDFDPRSQAVLELLLHNPEGVYSQQILDLVENPDLNPAHNIKVKNQLIDNLNFRFKSLLSLEEDLIKSHRSPQDKRIKIYRIQASYFRLR